MVPIINNLLNYQNERFCIKLTDEHDEEKKILYSNLIKIGLSSSHILY